MTVKGPIFDERNPSLFTKERNLDCLPQKTPKRELLMLNMTKQDELQLVITLNEVAS